MKLDPYDQCTPKECPVKRASANSKGESRTLVHIFRLSFLSPWYNEATATLGAVSESSRSSVAAKDTAHFRVGFSGGESPRISGHGRSGFRLLSNGIYPLRCSNGFPQSRNGVNRRLSIQPFKNRDAEENDSNPLRASTRPLKWPL